MRLKDQNTIVTGGEIQSCRRIEIGCKISDETKEKETQMNEKIQITEEKKDSKKWKDSDKWIILQSGQNVNLPA